MPLKIIFQSVFWNQSQKLVKIAKLKKLLNFLARDLNERTRVRFHQNKDKELRGEGIIGHIYPPPPISLT